MDLKRRGVQLPEVLGLRRVAVNVYLELAEYLAVEAFAHDQGVSTSQAIQGLVEAVLHRAAAMGARLDPAGRDRGRNRRPSPDRP